MLVDYPIEFLFVETGVPGALRVHDGDTALFADAETIGLGSENRAGTRLHRVGVGLHVTLPLRRRRRGVELFETALQVRPQLTRLVPGCTPGIGLVCTEENVSPHSRYGEGLGNVLQTLLGDHSDKLSHLDALVRSQLANDNPAGRACIPVDIIRVEGGQETARRLGIGQWLDDFQVEDGVNVRRD